MNYLLNRHFLFFVGIILTFCPAPVLAQQQPVPAVIRIKPARLITPATISPGQIQIEWDDQSGGTPVTAGSTARSSAINQGTNDKSRTLKLQARLKKLSKLKFDRLPSQILKTWAHPDGNKSTKELEQLEDLPPAPRKAFLYSDERFAMETDKLKNNFTLGNWSAIEGFMAMLPEADAKRLYSKLLDAVAGAGARELADNSGANDRDSRAYQTPFFTFDDVLQIASISPGPLKDPEISKLAHAYALVIQQGNSADELFILLHDETQKDDPVFDRRQIAKILMAANLPIPAGQFLPDLAQAKKENDHEALNLLSRHFLAQFAKDEAVEQLEEAWNVTQAILASEDVDKDERKQALKRAVDLSRKVRKELGQDWLNESFVVHPDRGMEVLAAIGADVSQSMLRRPRDIAGRLALLKLQHDAVEALLSASPEPAAHWQHTLNLLAQNWLREAMVSYTDDESKNLGPRMQRDQYGNIFYFDQAFNQRSRMRSVRNLSPISTGELLKVKPSEKWISLVDDSIKPKFDMIQAQLYLKVAEQDLALPFIEKLAADHPKQAEDLVDEFLQVWTTNHNPNSERSRTNYYMFMYGYESRAESIPLTRSKQKRNLEELSALIPRLNELIEGELKQELVLAAFFTCHSTAEVYRIEDIENVFGEFDKIKPEIISDLAQRMRMNLATMWRDATAQKKSKTKRKKKEMEAEVIRGYEVARQVVDDAIRLHPDDWSLMVVDAALIHDENNYRAELENSSQFTSRRTEAMSRFKQAADKYSKAVIGLEEKDYSTKAYETWFYASLGACDLGLIKPTNLQDTKQTTLIRNALKGLPEKVREWHLDRFAVLLFNRMSAAKPELKHSYLDAGFEIVGDNKNAQEAKKVHDYYKDLVSEIKLVTRIDGDDRVGTEPFGVYVSLLHTKEIERESGGFGRYLQNQNSSAYFSYNYGRPTEDYRDKFEESIRELMNDQFELMSVTFQTPEVKSIASGQRGWRETPYAYILLKARGPEVDVLPPVKIDMDFLDTSGYAILPLESPAIPIDASNTSKSVRPYGRLKVTQILDERQSEDGKLVLEIKATSDGLVPDLETILPLNNNNFDVANIEDQGLAVSRFDEEGNGTSVVSERSWLVSMIAKSGKGKPRTFEFPVPDLDTDELLHQRYVDADLADVDSIIELEEKYGKFNYQRAIGFGAMVLVGLLLFGFAFVILSKPRADRRISKYQLDESPTPFSAISLLEDIQRNNGLNARQKTKLDESINRLEQYYFGESNDQNDPEPDLVAEVRKWTKRAK